MCTHVRALPLALASPALPRVQWCVPRVRRLPGELRRRPGADSSASIDNVLSDTPLYLAVESGADGKIAKLLLDRGANVNTPVSVHRRRPS